MTLLEKLEKALKLAKQIELNDEQTRGVFLAVLSLPLAYYTPGQVVHSPHITIDNPLTQITWTTNEDQHRD